MDVVTLYGSPGTGSAIVEFLFEKAELALRYEELDYEKDVVEKSPKVMSLNPLARVPFLRLPDGEILTESGAIAFFVAGRSPAAKFVPDASDPDYGRFLRIFFLLTGEIYPTFTFGDIPSEWVSSDAAQKELVDSVHGFRKELWAIVENAITPGPWAMGKRFTLIDAYLCAMVHWRPGRAWFREHCPKITSVVEHARGTGELDRTFDRNFDEN